MMRVVVRRSMSKPSLRDSGTRRAISRLRAGSSMSSQNATTSAKPMIMSEFARPAPNSTMPVAEDAAKSFAQEMSDDDMESTHSDTRVFCMMSA